MWSPDPSTFITVEQKHLEQLASVKETFGATVQALLNEKARERGYDSIVTAVSYRGDPNPQYDAEAVALFNWRSAMWSHVGAELEKVLSGVMDIPTIKDFTKGLPRMEWPKEV